MGQDKTYDRHINIWINGKEVKNDIASIKKEMFNLTNELARTTRGTKEYNEKAAELQKVKGILKEHQENIAATGSSWTKLKGLFSSAQGIFLAGLGAITAGYQSLKGIITSTDELGDKFDVTLAGWKGGLDAVARAIATLDFKNLGKNIKAAIEEGRRYVAELDQIDEKTRALKIAESEAANELLKQREIQNDVRKSLTERNDAGKKAIKIEEDLADIRTKIGKQGYENEAKNIATITHLTEAEVLAFAKQEALMVANIEAGRKYNQMVTDRDKLQVLTLQGIKLTDEQSEQYRYLNEQIATTNEEIKRFAFAAANMPGDEKMQLFVDKYVAYQQAIGSALDNTLKIRSKQAKTEKELLDEHYDNLSKVVAAGIQNPAYNADDYIKKEVERLVAAEKEANEERQKDFEETEQAKTEALIKEGERGKQEALDTWSKIKETDRKNLEDKVIAYTEFGAKIGEIVGQSIADGTMTAREGAKQIISIALDTLGNYATIMAVQAAVGSLASPESIATWGIAGALKAALLAGLIKAAMAGVKAVISRNLYTGGYTGDGGKYEPAGIVHKGEYVVDAETYSNPAFRPMIDAMEYARVNGTNGYANGGGPGIPPSGSGAVGSAPAIFGSDPELKQLIRENSRINKILLIRGVKTNFTYKDVDSLRQGMSRLEDNESDVTM